MRLYRTRLHDIGIDGALGEETDARELARLFLKHADELCADNLALLFGIGHTSQFVEEPVGGIDIHQIGVEFVAEHTNHLLWLAFAQQTVIHMNRYQLFADSLDKQGSHHGRVNTSREGEQHFLVANLSTQLTNLFVDKFLGQFGRRDALHVGRTYVSCCHKFLVFLSDLEAWDELAELFAERLYGVPLLVVV